MAKKTILHFIYSLGRGGAETMLVRYIRELSEYNNIVITLKNDNHFEKELVCDTLVCLDKPSLFSIPTAALRLRSLIKLYHADIVHSHLPVANFIARLATPSKIPLITTIHNSIATSKDYKHFLIRLLDKSTYKLKKSTIIAVSRGALDDYFTVLNIKSGDATVLHNFVDTDTYKIMQPPRKNDTFKVVCVGALSVQKNHAYLIKAFNELKNERIELDIYGKGDQQLLLENMVKKYKVHVALKGQVSNIHEVLSGYNLYVMSSIFEGSSLSVFEAMALQMPLLLSDIPSFREQCEATAVYFDLNDIHDFVKKIKHLSIDTALLETMGRAAKERVEHRFTLIHYMKGLRQIYSAALNRTTK